MKRRGVTNIAQRGKLGKPVRKHATIVSAGTILTLSLHWIMASHRTVLGFSAKPLRLIPEEKSIAVERFPAELCTMHAALGVVCVFFPFNHHPKKGVLIYHCGATI